MIKHVSVILTLVLVCLLLGTAIYYYFRVPVDAFAKLHITQVETQTVNKDNPFIYFLIYCLPDALWYMSLLLVQTLFFEEKGWLNRLLIGTAICLPFLLEAGQCFGFVSGTFDWYDILTYCITLILFLCLKRTSLLSHSKSL